jgi:hypothetical protein
MFQQIRASRRIDPWLHMVRRQCRAGQEHDIMPASNIDVRFKNNDSYPRITSI